MSFILYSPIHPFCDNFLGGLLYLIGGRTNSAIDKIDSDSLECYDPFTHEWTTLAPLNTPRHRLGLGTIDGVVYALGGSDGMIHLNSMEKYDVAEDFWTPLASMMTRRMGNNKLSFMLLWFHPGFSVPPP